jgi:hypothetical protein
MRACLDHTNDLEQANLAQRPMRIPVRPIVEDGWIERCMHTAFDECVGLAMLMFGGGKIRETAGSRLREQTDWTTQSLLANATQRLPKAT